MVVSADALLVIVLVGLTAGWLAGQSPQLLQRADFRQAGFGLVGDLVVGVGGAALGGWLLPKTGISPGTGLVAAIVNASIGALLLLLLMSRVRGHGGWRRDWLGW